MAGAQPPAQLVAHQGHFLAGYAQVSVCLRGTEVEDSVDGQLKLRTGAYEGAADWFYLCVCVCVCVCVWGGEKGEVGKEKGEKETV